SATPTSPFPDVPPSPTPDIRFPTEISGEVPMGDGITIPQAAGLPADSGVATEIALPEIERPNLLTVSLRDGSVLNAEVYPGRAGMPGVLLVGASFEAWGGFPVILRDLGYTVMTVEGGVSAEASAMPAILDTLAVQPNLDSGRFVVMGVAEGSDMALVGCASQSRCIGAVVISPTGLAGLADAARAMGPRPVLLAASETDGVSLATAEAARQAAQNATLQSFEDAGRGTQILNTQPDFVALVGQWLAEISGS
ncbi:MAG: hypothetical protein MUF38_20480, partial [Anaerolineae bacterium]|nr:hypothetical protein [Anaerolineae bacterium]